MKYIVAHSRGDVQLAGWNPHSLTISVITNGLTAKGRLSSYDPQYDSIEVIQLPLEEPDRTEVVEALQDVGHEI